jgi:superfamily I DNA and/or RNA helicase
MRDVLLGLHEPRFGREHPVPFATTLNPPQEQAVRFALSARDLAIVHGPPGTGKTTTLTEVIVQAVRRGDKVLACAPSNTAVDNLLERLVAQVPSVLRVGHPARVFESLRGHTLDELVEADPTTAVIRDMLREAELQQTTQVVHRDRQPQARIAPRFLRQRLPRHRQHRQLPVGHGQLHQLDAVKAEIDSNRQDLCARNLDHQFPTTFWLPHRSLDRRLASERLNLNRQ